MSEYRDPRERRFVRSSEPTVEPEPSAGDVAVTEVAATAVPVAEVTVVAPIPESVPERRRFTRRSVDGPGSQSGEPGRPEGRLARRLTAVVEAAYGNPTPHEAAAIAAAVQTILDAEAVARGPETPEAYRSSWRRAAIHEAVRRMDVP